MVAGPPRIGGGAGFDSQGSVNFFTQYGFPCQSSCLHGKGWGPGQICTFRKLRFLRLISHSLRPSSNQLRLESHILSAARPCDCQSVQFKYKYYFKNYFPTCVEDWTLFKIIVPQCIPKFLKIQEYLYWHESRLCLLHIFGVGGAPFPFTQTFHHSQMTLWRFVYNWHKHQRFKGEREKFDLSSSIFRPPHRFSLVLFSPFASPT